MKLNLQNKSIQGDSPSLIFFFHSVCQSVSHSIVTYMFECFARCHVFSVSPSTYREQLTCVDVAFYFKFGFG